MYVNKDLRNAREEASVLPGIFVFIFLWGGEGLELKKKMKSDKKMRKSATGTTIIKVWRLCRQAQLVTKVSIKRG